MQVFHGSYTEIESVDLSKCQANKDFGKGFYVTKFRKQAEEWAEIIGKVNGAAGVVTELYKKKLARNIQNVKNRVIINGIENKIINKLKKWKR
jgi:hypothetical protein